MNRRVARLILFALFSCGVLLAQATEDARKSCETLRSTAVRLSSQEAMKLAMQKDMPAADEKYADARVDFAVWVDQEGNIGCAAYMGSKPDLPYYHGDMELVGRVAKAIRNWKFKTYVIKGKPRAFTTVFSFHFKGKTVTID